jgi:CRISPR-associated protein Cmr6
MNSPKKTNASKCYFVDDTDYGWQLYTATIQELLTGKRNDILAVQNISIADKKYYDYFSNELVNTTIDFTIKYPGLVVGAGYEHPAMKDSDFQMGFSFDHTTGMPVIPGSTVKGVLKSVFPGKRDDDDDETHDNSNLDKINDNKVIYISDIIKKNYKALNVNYEQLKELIKKNWEEIFFKRKQIFFDAFIVKPIMENMVIGNKTIPIKNTIFADDYLCPHHDNPFKEPTPLRFLKIAPDVTIRFQFKLLDYSENPAFEIKTEHIKQVFKQILIDFGIGAKRNYGYGNLKEKTQNVAQSV